MTTYAVMDGTTTIVASWDTGDGAVCTPALTTTAARWDPPTLLRLTGLLSFISDLLWRAYERGETATLDSRVKDMLDAVAKPEERHTKDGTIEVHLDPLVAAADQIGRLIAGAPEAAAVRDLLTAETDTVREALAGRFDGAAAQARNLSRTVTIPSEVARARLQLAGDPLGAELSDVDAASAAIAAMEALQSAMELAQYWINTPPPVAMLYADDIQSVPAATYTLVTRMAAGCTPADLLTELVGAAHQVADGDWVPPLPVTPEAARLGITHDERICVLDPTRPASDLLESALAGITAYWVLIRDQHTRSGHEFRKALSELIENQ